MRQVFHRRHSLKGVACVGTAGQQDADAERIGELSVPARVIAGGSVLSGRLRGARTNKQKVHNKVVRYMGWRAGVEGGW